MRKLWHLVPMLFAGGMASVVVTGCLGPKVLEERAEHLPAPDPNVELRLKSEKPADILVVYDDQEKRSGKLTRRAFFLFADQERLGRGKRPTFIGLDRIGDYSAIPIFKEPLADSKTPPGDLFALSSSPWQFKLQSRDHTVAEFELPAYGNWLTAKKFFLFPVAAAADAVAVGAVVGAATALGYAESGGSITIH